MLDGTGVRQVQTLRASVDDALDYKEIPASLPRNDVEVCEQSRMSICEERLGLTPIGWLLCSRPRSEHVPHSCCAPPAPSGSVYDRQERHRTV